MAIDSDKAGTIPPPKTAGKVQDYFLDPLPVPDAHESNGDTVWGMWEDSLEAQSAAGEPSEDPPDFEKTIISPMDDPA